jgi:O-antigen/teichoic acid export membrane protein
MTEPIVSLLYGSQWDDAIPIVRIFAVALMLNFPTALNYPIQVAVGAIRHTVPLAFAQTAVSLVVLTIAARYGIRAVALSTFITVPFNMGLSVLVVRAHIPFPWSEFAGTTMKSAVVAALSAAGPLAVVASSGAIGHAILPIAMAIGLCGVGWLAGLWLTRHPLLHEVRNVAEGGAKFVAAGLGIFNWPFGGPR